MRSQNIGSDPLPGFYLGKMKHIFLRKFGYVQKYKNKKEHLFGSWYEPGTKPITDDVVDKEIFKKIREEEYQFSVFFPCNLKCTDSDKSEQE